MRELVRRLLPVVGRRVLGRDAEGQHRQVGQVGVVAEHPDLALERRVEEIVHARDRGIVRTQLLHLHRIPPDPGETRLPRHRELVAVVVRRALHRVARVLVEVGPLVGGKRHQVVEVEQLVEGLAVGDHDDVPASVFARGQVRLDLAEEAGVGLDHLVVLDLDARVLRELLQRGVHHLAGGRVLRLVDVERPVREVQGLGGGGVPVDRGGGGARARARVPTARTRREDRRHAERPGADAGGLEEVPARHPPLSQAAQERWIDLRAVVALGHSSSSSSDSGAEGSTTKVCSGSHSNRTCCPGCGREPAAPRFWTYTVISMPPGPSTLYW